MTRFNYTHNSYNRFFHFVYSSMYRFFSFLYFFSYFYLWARFRFSTCFFSLHSFHFLRLRVSMWIKMYPTLMTNATNRTRLFPHRRTHLLLRIQIKRTANSARIWKRRLPIIRIGKVLQFIVAQLTFITRFLLLVVFGIRCWILQTLFRFSLITLLYRVLVLIEAE